MNEFEDKKKEALTLLSNLRDDESFIFVTFCGERKYSWVYAACRPYYHFVNGGELPIARTLAGIVELNLTVKK